MAEEYNRRSVKTLQAAKAASAHQKEWFLSLRERVAAGEPLLFGMAPLEIIHAMDIPCVITVWWTALCAAKQYGKQMYGYLDDAGYRIDYADISQEAIPDDCSLLICFNPNKDLSVHTCLRRLPMLNL